MILLTLILVLAGQAFAIPLAEQIRLIRQFESGRAERRVSLDADSIHSYNQIALSLDYRVEEESNAPLTGTATITLRAVQEMESIPLNAENLTIYSVQESGTPLNYSLLNDTLWVERPLLPEQEVSLDIELSAPVVQSFFEVGYHTDWQRVFTFCEPYGARRWYPCWDQPYDKFDEVTIAVNMPDHWSLASNGFLISTTFPESGRKREVYEYNDPVSSYLIMIAAGIYAKRYDEVEGIEYRYFTYPEDSSDAVIDWDMTPQMVAYYSGILGDYPFDAYGMVETAIFNGWGAMEHQTFTTYGWRLIDGQRTYEGIVSHELVHQWFGDYLSPVDFRNMWLNEGFATYFGALWFDNLYGEEELEDMLTGMANAYFSEDQDFRYAAYDPPDGYLFGSVIYNKAGFVLHMLRKQLLGDSLFFAVIQEYVDRFADGTVNTEDLIEVVNELSGEDCRWFFDQWIYDVGHPVLWTDLQTDSPAPGDVTLRSIQTQFDAPVFRYPLLLDITTDIGTLQEFFWFDDRDQTVTRNYSGLISASIADFQPLLYRSSATSIDPDPAGLPVEVRLSPAYPNPFNSTISIPFELNSRSRVDVSVYNISGQLVDTVVDAVFNSGSHVVSFAASPDLASGLYLVRLETGQIMRTQKIILLK